MISLDKISDLVHRMNLNLNDGYTDLFTLNTNGYKWSILFNDVDLWNSDESSIVDIENLENFIKKEFNDYIDNLKLSRFKTSHKEERFDDGVFEAADEIFLNLNDRSLGLDTLGEDLQQEIFDEMVNTIRKHV